MYFLMLLYIYIKINASDARTCCLQFIYLQFISYIFIHLNLVIIYYIESNRQKCFMNIIVIALKKKDIFFKEKMPFFIKKNQFLR